MNSTRLTAQSVELSSLSHHGHAPYVKKRTRQCTAAGVDLLRVSLAPIAGNLASLMHFCHEQKFQPRRPSRVK